MRRCAIGHRRAGACRLFATARWSRRRVVLAACASLILALPRLSAAQSTEVWPIVGYLEPRPDSAAAAEWIGWFRDELSRRGFVDGESVGLLTRHGEGDPARFADLARELVSAGSRIIVTRGTTAVRAARDAAPSVPLVMGGSADPVAMGWAKSLSRPGGKITGVSIFGAEMIGKRLELLKQVVPSGRTVAAFLQSANPGNQAFQEALRAAAAALGLEMKVREIGGPAELREAFAWAAGNAADGVFVIEDPMFVQHRQALFGLAKEFRLPTVSGNVDLARAGALAIYAPDPETEARETARLVAEILRGADPGELPIVQPTRLRLVLNLKTAAALGIEMPPALLARADEVIE
jgi:putative ABC transport system substrate-binding protein